MLMPMLIPELVPELMLMLMPRRMGSAVPSVTIATIASTVIIGRDHCDITL
jgi:hypothetical protein